jgi:hypothetical protein
MAVLSGGPRTSEPSFRRAGEDRTLLETYYARYPAWRFLAPTCTTEVITGSEGTGIASGRPVPGEILPRLACRPRRGPRRGALRASSS